MAFGYASLTIKVKNRRNIIAIHDFYLRAIPSIRAWNKVPSSSYSCNMIAALLRKKREKNRMVFAKLVVSVSRKHPFQIDRHRTRISWSNFGEGWTLRTTVASRGRREGVAYGLSKTWYSGPLPEKVVGWACLVAISAGVTSRTARGFQWRAPV